MVQTIYDMMKNLALFFILTQIILQMLPGSRYRQYVKLVLGIVILLYLLTPVTALLRGQPTFPVDEFFDNYEKRLQNVSTMISEMQEKQNNEILSTYNEEVKSEINKLIEEEKMSVKALKIDICEDEQSEGFGQVQNISVLLDKNVDNSVDISVSPIRVEEVSLKQETAAAAGETGTEEARHLAERMEAHLGLPAGVVQVQIRR